MNTEELKDMLDKAEQMGYTRGVLIAFTLVFNLMDEKEMLSIGLEDLKRLYEATKNKLTPPLDNKQ